MTGRMTSPSTIPKTGPDSDENVANRMIFSLIYSSRLNSMIALVLDHALVMRKHEGRTVVIIMASLQKSFMLNSLETLAGMQMLHCVQHDKSGVSCPRFAAAGDRRFGRDSH
jgi:hypothetical protein